MAKLQPYAYVARDKESGEVCQTFQPIADTEEHYELNLHIQAFITDQLAAGRLVVVEARHAQ